MGHVGENVPGAVESTGAWFREGQLGRRTELGAQLSEPRWVLLATQDMQDKDQGPVWGNTLGMGKPRSLAK